MKRTPLLLVLMPGLLVADVVYLEGGASFTGRIVEQTEERMVIDIGDGTIGFSMDRVEKIEKGPSALDEHDARAARLEPQDVNGWRSLAQWARTKGLSAQARAAYHRVLAVAPDDPEAREALGFVRLDGQWLTEEESYRARGYVEFENQWMMPGERQSILSERQAREQADRQANEAEVRAIQAEIDAEQQREDEEFERKSSQFDRLPDYGDPIAWGWGAGPAYWPSAVVYSQPQELGAAPVGGR